MSIDERTAGDLRDVAPIEPLPADAPDAGLDDPAAAPAEAPAAKSEPVAAAERVGSVDVIRGAALLGILAMNIVGFAWPDPVYSIPVIDPDAGAFDTALWAFNHLVFDTKMMTLFTMLFGGGLVLMSGRAEARGAKYRGVYYRRIAWLLVIGLIHSYLIWEGDVLVDYALCGFLLFPFRNLKPRTLIVTGVVLNLLLVPLLLCFRFGGVPYMRATAERVDAQVKAGGTPGWWSLKVHDGWKEMSKEELPKRDKLLNDVQTLRGGYVAIVKARAGEMIWAQAFGFLIFGWSMIGGRMLIGMGLMRLGVFSAALSARAYRVMMLVGYGAGLPLLAFDAWHEIHNNFFLGRRLAYALDGWPLLSLYGSVFVVFGHIGLVMLAYQAGAFAGLTRRLSAVGRMALSNYLFDSLFCTTLFYGYGFDLYGSLHRPMLYVIVLAIWTVQLLVSPLWLDVFRFGPAEWVWRSLTYWKPQPMLRRGGV